MPYYPTRENGGLRRDYLPPPSRRTPIDFTLLSVGQELEREFAITNAVMQMNPDQADKLEAWLDEIPPRWRFRARRRWREQVPLGFE